MFPWHHMIDEASSLDMVLALVRDYLACWGPDDLALIPERARPHRVKSVEDIAFWHQRLLDSYLAGSPKSRECDRVRSMLHFFACALQKATDLEGSAVIGELDGAAPVFTDDGPPRLFTPGIGANDA